jgi:hypothetical protein
MANNFQITISAIDKATATTRKINDAFSRLIRPFAQIQKSVQALGKELGFEKIAKSLRSVGKAAGDAARKIGSIVAPLAAVVGVGSIAGVYALATGWAKLGSEIGRTAETIGVSTGDLQSLRGAARLAGASSEELTAGLHGLGTTLQDARFGRNNEAMYMLNTLGIRIKKTASGAVDSVQAFKDLADAIQMRSGQPQTQERIAQQFGLAGLLPLLRKGSKGIRELEDETAALGGVFGKFALDNAQKFQKSMTGLDIAVDGLKIGIGSALMPVLMPLLNRLGEWVAKNQALISTRVGEFVQKFGDWVSKIDFDKVLNGLTAFIDKIDKTIDSLGGVKGVALILAGLTFAGPIAGVISLTTSVGALILRLGALTATTAGIGAGGAAAGVGAAGIAAGGVAVVAAGAAGYGIGTLVNKYLIEGTSIGDKIGEGIARTLASFGNKDAGEAIRLNTGRDDYQTGPGAKVKPSSVVDFFKRAGWNTEQAAGIAANLQRESNFDHQAVGDSGKAFGVAQWHGDRQAEFKKWSGKDMRQSTLEDQLRFVQYELTRGNERSAGDKLRGARTAAEAGSIVSRYYERPAAVQNEAAQRGQQASQLAQAQPAAPTQVVVEFKNAPPGMTATARTKSGMAMPVRVNNAMPAEAAG